MPKPWTGSDRAGDASRTESLERKSPRRRAPLWALVAIVSYGLTLSILSDTFFLLAMPGMLGLAIVVIMAVQAVQHRSFGADAPYATDGTDCRGVVRYHYSTLLKRYAATGVSAAALGAVPLLADIAYLYPLLGVGILGIVIGTYTLLDQLMLVRKCSRILAVYDPGFRSPVYKLTRQSRGRRQLRMGDGALRSPKMSARAPVNYEDWPGGIADGVWFAGDDPFGGVLLVPGSGDLMCMQPLDWATARHDRARAGAERIAKAGRAGLVRHSM